MKSIWYHINESNIVQYYRVKYIEVDNSKSYQFDKNSTTKFNSIHLKFGYSKNRDPNVLFAEENKQKISDTVLFAIQKAEVNYLKILAIERKQFQIHTR